VFQPLAMCAIAPEGRGGDPQLQIAPQASLRYGRCTDFE